MEAYFECPVCLEGYDTQKKPLLIPCGHTACSECLSFIFNRSRVISCPTCRNEYNISINQLPVNYALMAETSSKGSRSMWQDIQTLSNQIVSHRKKRENLEAEYTQIAKQNEKNQTEVLQKIEMIQCVLEKLKANVTGTFQEVNESNARQFQDNHQTMEIQDGERNDLLNKMKQAYDSNKELLIDDKLKLEQLSEDSELNIRYDICIESHEEEPLLASLKLLKVGVLNVIKQDQINSQRAQEEEKINLIASQASLGQSEEFKGRARGNRNQDRLANSVIKEKKDKFQDSKWKVKNKNGIVLGLKPYVCDAIDRGMERGENAIDIYNEKNLLSERVYLDRMMIYKVNRHGKETQEKNLIREEGN